MVFVRPGSSVTTMAVVASLVGTITSCCLTIWHDWSMTWMTRREVGGVLNRFVGDAKISRLRRLGWSQLYRGWRSYDFRTFWRASMLQLSTSGCLIIRRGSLRTSLLTELASVKNFSKLQVRTTVVLFIPLAGDAKIFRLRRLRWSRIYRVRTMQRKLIF